MPDLVAAKPARKPKAPKIAKAVGRSVTEWIGRTPDSRPPKTVRLRIFDRDNGVCYLTGVKIKPGDDWDVEHVKRLEDGGENRESNMRPALKAPHRVKTAEENSRGKKADRVRKKHIGIKVEPAKKLESAGFAPAPEKDRSKPDKTKIGTGVKWVFGVAYADN
jgi:5-methylcytosine-specific restriction endonuclease McrA